MTCYLMLDQDMDSYTAIVSFMKGRLVDLLANGASDDKIIEHLQHLTDVMKGQYLTSDRTVDCGDIVYILHKVAAKHLERGDYTKLMVVNRWIIDAQCEETKQMDY